MTTEKVRKLTGWMIVLLVAAGGLYDVFAFTMGGTEGTISHVVNSWSYNYPAFTFAVGFLMGHLFWRTSKDPKKDPKKGDT